MTVKTHISSHVSLRKYDAGEVSHHLLHNPHYSLPGSIAQVQRVLQNPICFVPATFLTFEDEDNMKATIPIGASEHGENVLLNPTLSSTDIQRADV